jgi:hypothetical protein
MNMKRDTHSDREEGDPREAAEVLSIVNAAQFFLFLIRAVYLFFAYFMLHLGQLGISAGRGVAWAIIHSARVITFVCRCMFLIIERSAYALSFAFAWVITSVIWGCFSFLAMLVLGIWRVSVFVGYRIPRFIITAFIHVVSRAIETCSFVGDEVVARIAALPETMYHAASETRQSFTPPVGWMRRIAAFVGIALLFTLPLPALHSYQFLNDVRADTERESIEALALLEKGKDALTVRDFQKAIEIFSESKDHFDRAAQSLLTIPSPIMSAAKLVPFAGRKISDGDRLILIGQHVADAGLAASRLLQEFSRIKTDPNDFLSGITMFFEQGGDIFQHLVDADILASAIDHETVPNEYRGRFLSLRSQLHTLVDGGSIIVPSRDILLRIFGSQTKRRYLLVFQNNTELRPTGGFIGSYALIDVLKGSIVSTEIPGGGSYDLKGSLSQRVQSPMPLRLVNPAWQFQDSNWFPDFPTSAKKMIWFYEKSGGPTVDGVIAVNASFFPRLLTIMGTIDMPAYGKRLTAENFMLETQKAVELEYDKTQNRPKAFIGDLFPMTIEKMSTLSPTQKTSLFQEILASFSSRDIQAYMRDALEQEGVRRLGISGEMRGAPLDYFSVVQANVGGGKGEGVIDEDIMRETIFRPDGTVETRVRIHRAHKGIPGDPFGGVRNVSYIRLYFPKGTQALSATGFSPPDPVLFKSPLEGYRVDDTLLEVEGVPVLDPATGMTRTDEYGKTVYAQWMMLQPQEEAVAEARFLLPFRVTDIPQNRGGSRQYTLLVQRQSGSTTQKLTSVFTSDGTVRFGASIPESTSLRNDTVTIISDPFLADQAIGLTIDGD